MDPNQSFNLIDIAQVLSQRKKFIVLFVLLAAIVAAVLTFFVLPKQYKSTAIIVAANPVLADKARLFNENIEGLYSAYGDEDDLNRLYGIANLDTTYKILVDKFKLVPYYNIQGHDAALNQRKAVAALKDDVELTKTELYQLKIAVTTKDKLLSASIANQMVELVQAMAQDVHKQTYKSTLQKIVVSSESLQQEYKALIDSSGELAEVKKQSVLQQLEQNEKVANQYKMALANNAPALISLEKAYPSARADKPDKLLIILGAIFSALAFSIITVLILERRQ